VLQDILGAHLSKYLGLDVGGTSTRWTLLNHLGEVSSKGEAKGFSASSSLKDVLEAASASFNEIKEHLGSVQSITAGITGLNRGSDVACALARVLSQTFSVTDVSIMSDIELQFRTHFKPGIGIIIYCGTGAIAGHVSKDGLLSTAGGRGVIIDDAGGAYWIAVAGLRTILRLEDRSPHAGWTTPMGRSMGLSLGSTDWSQVKEAVASKSRGEFALLARCVADAARKGDALAVGILRQAGAELALIADMLIDRIGLQPIILTGRGSELHSEILIAMKEALPNVQITQTYAEASDAAARIAHGIGW
jgi:glucosamine kinase